MITEDHKDETTTRQQETVPNSEGATSEKICPSPCFSTSPSSSPSAVKSSTECGGSTSGDDCEGITYPPRNGILGNVTPDGVLTPPTDLECQAEPAASKPLRYNGRLEFYKEGVMCLELSHCEEEGQGRKWLKTKGRSEVRQIVRVSKEVSIPCCPLPPNQLVNSHPPNGLSSLHDNLSDEGSSAGSSSGSPKSRDKSWRKQPVPQKLISGSLEFFMKPSPCVHALLFAKKRKVSLTELTPRRPYALPQLSLWIRNPHSESEPNLCDCGNPRRRKYFSATTKKSLFKRKPLLERITLRLRVESEKSSSIFKTKTNLKNPSPRSTPLKVQRQYSATCSTSARKRGSKEIEGHESELKNHKRSPTKNLEKTILSVPGIGVGSPLGGNRNSAHKPRPVHPGFDATDGRGGETRGSPPNPDLKKYAKSHAGRSSPYSLLRPPSERGTRSNDGSPLRDAEAEDSAQEQEDMLTPEEQQQYAMSRAISYTITSLLSQGSPSLHMDKRTMSSPDIASSQSQFPNPGGGVKGLTHPGILNPFGTEQDKNSFLRHLLDTSDPIPTSTHSSVTGSAAVLPPPLPVQSKPLNQSPDPTPQKARSGNKGKRNNRTPCRDKAGGKGRSHPVNSGSGDHKSASILSHPPMIYGSGGTPPVSSGIAPSSSGSLYPYAAPSAAQLESIKAAAMQYASHLIPPNPRGKFGNHRDRIQPPATNSYTGGGGGDEAPINLSQKDGDWPEVKVKNDRASRLQVEGRVFPIVPHGNLNNESDPDLPLDLCKKRRDD